MRAWSKILCGLGLVVAVAATSFVGAFLGTPRMNLIAAREELDCEVHGALGIAKWRGDDRPLFVDWDVKSGRIQKIGAPTGAYATAGLIRALPFHAARHKVYLPKDLLAAVGLSPEQIMSGNFDIKVKAAVAQTALKAREHWLAARTMRVRRQLLPAFLPAALVPLYLRRSVRRGFDPLKHSGDVPQHRKQMALLGAALRKRV